MASFYADPMDPAHMTDEAVRDLACIRLIAKIVSVCLGQQVCARCSKVIFSLLFSAYGSSDDI